MSAEAREAEQVPEDQEVAAALAVERALAGRVEAVEVPGAVGEQEPEAVPAVARGAVGLGAADLEAAVGQAPARAEV